MATETTKLTFIEGAAASTPASGRGVVYFKADGLAYSKDDAGVETLMSSGSVGSVATDPIWDAAGDLVQGTGANTAAKLGAGTAAMFLKSAGAAAANLWAFPPGYEWAYAAITADVTTTSTSPADATGLTVTYTADGAAVIVEAYFPELSTTASAGGDQRVVGYLYDTTAAAAIQAAYVFSAPAGFGSGAAVLMRAKVTPGAGSQSYKVRFQTVQAGTATIRAAAANPAYIRVVKG